MDKDETNDVAARSAKRTDEQRDRGDAGVERAPAHAYQEGSVESVGGRPSGADTDDRTGQAGPAPDVPRAAEREDGRDAFTSSEVAAESAGGPGRPERTRS
jgi:hypothetical protein